MRKLILAAALAAALNGCKRRDGAATIEGPAPLQSAIRASNLRTEGQFAQGFHQLESGAWRWTTRTFAITLKPPAGASAAGAVLKVDLTLPDTLLAKTGPITLSAQAGDQVLKPRTFDKAGAASYEADVPSAVLVGDSLRIDFSLDKFLAAGTVDQRELGVIVSAASLTAKK
jgi:hypothetical protein